MHAISFSSVSGKHGHSVDVRTWLSLAGKSVAQGDREERECGAIGEADEQMECNQLQWLCWRKSEFVREGGNVGKVKRYSSGHLVSTRVRVHSVCMRRECKMPSLSDFTSYFFLAYFFDVRLLRLI